MRAPGERAEPRESLEPGSARQETQGLVSGAVLSGTSLLSGISVGQLQRTPLGDWS